MTGVVTEINELAVWEGTIAEMGPYDTTTKHDLQVPSEFLERVRKSDSDPMFVTVEIEAGISKSKRIWKSSHLQQVVDKVNKERMSGNLGHPLLDQKKWESEFPEPQVVWTTAKMVGTNTAAFKGYILKSAKAREYLEMGLIDGVSVFGDSGMRPTPNGYEIVRFDPETIDFARKGRSGMTSRIVSLTGEQETSRGGAVEPKDVAALSPDEIKNHAPLVYKAIQDEAVTPLNTKIGEMETAVGTLQPQVDILGEIKKLLKLQDGDNPVEKITSLITQIEEAGSAEVKAFVASLVEKKVKTERGRKLVARLIGEMHTAYDGPLDDETKKKIEADFTAKVEEDDDIKELIGEMAPFNEGNEDGNKNGGQGGTGLGGRSRAGSTRGRTDGENGIVKQNENITVRKVKV